MVRQLQIGGNPCILRLEYFLFLLQCASCPEHSVHQILEPSLEGLGACVAT